MGMTAPSLEWGLTQEVREELLGKRICNIKTWISEHKYSICNQVEEPCVAELFGCHKHSLSKLRYMSTEAIRMLHQGRKRGNTLDKRCGFTLNHPQSVDLLNSRGLKEEFPFACIWRSVPMLGAPSHKNRGGSPPITQCCAVCIKFTCIKQVCL